MLEVYRKAAAHWSKSNYDQSRRVRWWQSSTVKRHINRVVCGEPIEEQSAGAHRLLSRKGPFQRAISVGAGSGPREIKLVKSGLVEHFDLFELSAKRIEEGEARRDAAGLKDRITFHCRNGLEATGPYDLVYWDSALHHMLDVDLAVQWSKKILVPGGTFFMDDYVGPTRWQWTPGIIEAATRYLETLPRRYMRDPSSPPPPFPRFPFLHQYRLRPRRPRVYDPEFLMQDDPTEAADSGNILPAVARHFPDATVIPTGGVIYALALIDILDNFPEDDPMLQAALALDESIPETLHAVAIGSN